MFYDRKEAGQKLAAAIKSQIPNLNPQNSIILGLPRGGVIVANEVAKELKIPQDLIVVRKIGYPGNPEYAIGAVGESGELVLGQEESGISQEYLNEQVKKEKQEIQRRLREYRGNREVPDLKNKNLSLRSRTLLLRNKTVILVDDGLATGLSMKAAIKEVKAKSPAQIIVAIPVAPPDTVEELKKEVDEIICLETPSPFFAIGNFYTNFEQVTDEEVKKSLKEG